MSRGFELVVTDKKKHGIYTEINLPRRNDPLSAGYDFFSPIDFIIPANGMFMLWTDIKSYMKHDEFLLLDVRSSVPKGVRLNNTIGIIDSGYHSNPKNDGNIGFCFLNETDSDISFNVNDKIGQGIFMNYLITDDDEPVNSTRNGGFGSSGK